MGVSGYNGEGRNDRVGSALLQREVYAIGFVGLLRANECAQKHGFAIALFEVNGVFIDHFTAKFDKSLGYASKARNGHKITTHKTVVHLKVPFVFDMTHGEKALHYRSTVFHQPVVVGFFLLW